MGKDSVESGLDKEDGNRSPKFQDHWTRTRAKGRQGKDGVPQAGGVLVSLNQEEEDPSIGKKNKGVRNHRHTQKGGRLKTAGRRRILATNRKKGRRRAMHVAWITSSHRLGKGRSKKTPGRRGQIRLRKRARIDQ